MSELEPLERMESPERIRLRSAAARACQIYPGPVGELIARELDTWAELGYVIGPGLTTRLVEHVLATPIPAKAAP